MRRTGNTDYIAIHCSATPPSMNIGSSTIRKWHKERGFSDIGYNVIIKRDGTIEVGRPLDWRGAHIRGYNNRSVGVCLIGGVDDDGKAKSNFTEPQWDSLYITVEFLLKMWPGAKVQGHKDFPNVKKACPSFDAAGWWDVVCRTRSQLSSVE